MRAGLLIDIADEILFVTPASVFQRSGGICGEVENGRVASNFESFCSGFGVGRLGINLGNENV
jgi:hypothetical protein